MNKYLIILVLWLLSCVGAYFYGVGNKPQPEIKEVVKVETKREKITEIVEVPGKKTIIIRETENQISNSVKEKSKDKYIVSVSKSLVSDSYQVQASKKVFGDIFIGAYSNIGTDYGLTVGITF